MRFAFPTLVGLTVLASPAGLGAQHDGHAHDSSAVAPSLGKIDFPTSAAPAAHRHFERGVLYMHSFHYEEAAQAFREAQRLDPGDVMSYWGEAMSHTHPIWGEQDTAAARAVLRRLAPTRQERLARARTARERMYLDAVETLYEGDAPKASRDSAFARAMARVHAAYPRDDEAALFYALALMGQGERVDSTYLQAAAIAEETFQRRREHPGAAHYLIHALDNPTTAARALHAARAYSSIAPEASHALHMTSHIFVALGMWDDVVRANEQAQRAVGSQFGHYAFWLLYGLVQQGRVKSAEQWLDSIAGQASPGQLVRGSPRRRYHTSVMAAAWVIDAERWHSRWARLRVDGSGLGFFANDNELAIGLAALRRGERALADSMLGRMAARVIAPDSSGDGWNGSRELARVQEMTLRALTLHADGRSDSAIAMLRQAAQLEERQPYAFGPPATIKPPQEALGELLVELRRPADALTELDAALARTPRRTSVLLALARAHHALGHTADASRLYADLASIWKNADPDLPHLAEVRSRATADRARR